MPNTLYKAFQAEILAQKPPERRSLWAVASLEEPDREGDVILTDGWELENYRKNPVILFAHKYDQPPVARAAEIGVFQGRLRFKAQFPSRREYPFADTVYKLYQGGYLRSFSVGFIPKLWEDRETSQVTPRADSLGRTFSGGQASRGRLFRRQELVEISVVPIPTHPKALAEAQKKGLLGSEEVRILEDMAHVTPQAVAGGRPCSCPQTHLRRDSLGRTPAEEKEALLRLELLLKEAHDLKSRAILSQEEAVAAVERAMKESFRETER